jgi:hypothetical protein
MISVDDTYWPMGLIRFLGAQSDAEFNAYLEQVTSLINRGDRYTMVMITEPKTPMTKSHHAKQQAEWLAEHRETLERLNLGTAFILPSSVMRGVLRAILWMQPLPGEHKVFSTVPQGIAWAEAQLLANGIQPVRASQSG